ncbi:nitroreductase family protein [Salibacter sp.]|uniref:nitroreductase family protein n=1 Tax=Salibacter sp. TaxID=2010995 RepID=UPI0028703C77|nr:nitroreductase family protein [Salibacter sp.]MDR9399153.1 nitroreductase family protein [Salibacter sp.]MDR9488681.1 nitroreductase family protein [Salibacter sp.]
MIKEIKNRRSIRAFSDKKVSEQQLNELLDAARWAASCFNEQPWKFAIVEKGSDHYDGLFEALADGNKTWVKTAPVLGVSLAKKTFDRNGKPNKHAWHDVGMAMANMAIQATSMDLYIHQMAGFSPDKIAEYLDLDDNYEPVAMFTVGYKGESDQLPEDLAKQENSERKRKEIDEIKFW